LFLIHIRCGQRTCGERPSSVIIIAGRVRIVVVVPIQAWAGGRWHLGGQGHDV
jgi:hypothetical protein